MRFLVVASLSLFVGLALGSPIGQVDEVTTNVPELRSDMEVMADEATTVVVEVFADEAVTSATQKARQDNESEEEDEDATTVASSGSGASSTGRIRPPPAIPQPFANISNFLQEYEFSQQFNLGPKDESVPAAGVLTQVNPASESAPASPPVFPPAGVPLSANAVPAAPSNPTIVAAGEDDDEDVESDEVQTEAPAARQQQAQAVVGQQQPEAQRVEESDSDNEITNDDITTVKSFISEYEYTVQQLGGSEKRRDETEDDNGSVTEQVPTLASLTMLLTSNRSDPDLDTDSGGVLSDGYRAACECGKLPFRVPIGEEAEINLRPWTVAIVRGGLIAGGRPHCAGVLINDRYVLTSASCMHGLHPNGIQVWLTAHSTLYNHHLNVGTSKLAVQEIIVHPNYHRANKDNDICLVKMVSPVDIVTSSSYFTPICLPSVVNADYGGRYGQIFGWGNGRVNRICVSEVPILDNGVCKRDSRYGTRVTDNMMCAGYLTPSAPIRTDDCIGDAGSPLTVLIGGRTSLVGITSWGFEIHNRGHTPVVYTKISGYADWILHNTEDADWCAA